MPIVQCYKIIKPALKPTCFICVVSFVMYSYENLSRISCSYFLRRLYIGNTLNVSFFATQA